MTVEELKSKRDAILAALAQPSAMQAGDKSLTNRSVRELQAALAAIDEEIRRTESGTTAYGIGRFYTGEGL